LFLVQVGFQPSDSGVKLHVLLYESNDTVFSSRARSSHLLVVALNLRELLFGDGDTILGSLARSNSFLILSDRRPLPEFDGVDSDEILGGPPRSDPFVVLSL
jgi:hypothetical protein